MACILHRHVKLYFPVKIVINFGSGFSICTRTFSLTPPSLPNQQHSYDGHIHLLGYPFLDSKEEYVHDTLAHDVMHPRSNEPPLSVLDLSSVTVGSIQQLLEETDYFGYPCVLTASSQLLVGYVSRKDLQYVIGELSLEVSGICIEVIWLWGCRQPLV